MFGDLPADNHQHIQSAHFVLPRDVACLCVSCAPAPAVAPGRSTSSFLAGGGAGALAREHAAAVSRWPLGVPVTQTQAGPLSLVSSWACPEMGVETGLLGDVWRKIARTLGSHPCCGPATDALGQALLRPCACSRRWCESGGQACEDTVPVPEELTGSDSSFP